VEDLRLDARAENFSAVGRVVVGPGGIIVVPQPQDRNVRLYDSAGALIAEVGRRGKGPGEFERVGNMGWNADTLWIFDSELRRIVHIGLDGKVLRTDALSAAPMLWTAHDSVLGVLEFFSPGALRPDGSIVGGGRFVGQDNRSHAVVARLVPGSVARLVLRPPSFEDPRWFMEVGGFGRFIPFTAPPSAAISLDGTRYATLFAEFVSRDSGVVRVASYDWNRETIAPDTAPSFIRDFPFVGEPIPPAAVDSALATFISAPGQTREGPEDLPARFQALARQRMPTVYAPTSGIRLGADDTIWLDLRATQDGRLSLALDGNGDPIGTVLLPSNVTIRQSSRTHIWATAIDENDLVSVVRYRIEVF
jgi:hypothetical protein